MVGLLLEDKTAMQVTEKILSLKSHFSANGVRFSDIFPLLLTENGGEFANVTAIENSPNNEKATIVCNQ